MKDFIQKIKNFFAGIVAKIKGLFSKKPVTVVDPTAVAPSPVVTAPASSVPVVAPTSPVSGTGTTPTSVDGSAILFGSGGVVRPVDTTPNPGVLEPSSKRNADPTKTWFGLEFSGPGTEFSIPFPANGSYEVITGVDVDRGNIGVSIQPDIGQIHGGQIVMLNGTYQVQLTAIGPGGASVALNKVG